MIKAPDFWEWAFSDFMSNALRGTLAEYIVANALDCKDRPRVEWDAYDLTTAGGTKIEVKSSAYLQSWRQEKLSDIRFDISKKKSWDAQTNTSLSEAARSADVWVFCLFASKDKSNANPLDETQWKFMVCTSMFLDEVFAEQKSVGLSLLEKAGLSWISYNEVATAVAECMD